LFVEYHSFWVGFPKRIAPIEHVKAQCWE
jgi:hypothetical protein